MSKLKAPDNAKEGVVAHCARKRGRAPGFRMSEEHRSKIKNSCILRALIEYVQGERRMSATQVSVWPWIAQESLARSPATES